MEPFTSLSWKLIRWSYGPRRPIWLSCLTNFKCFSPSAAGFISFTPPMGFINRTSQAKANTRFIISLALSSPLLLHSLASPSPQHSSNCKVKPFSVAFFGLNRLCPPELRAPLRNENPPPHLSSVTLWKRMDPTLPAARTKSWWLRLQSWWPSTSKFWKGKFEALIWCMSRTCCSHSHTWNFVQNWGWDSHTDHRGLEYPDVTNEPVDTWDFSEAFSMSCETNDWTDFVPRKKCITAGWHRRGWLTIRVRRGRPPGGGQLVVQGGERSYAHTVFLLSAIAWPRVKRGVIGCMDDLKRPVCTWMVTHNT